MILAKPTLFTTVEPLAGRKTPAKQKTLVKTVEQRITRELLARRSGVGPAVEPLQLAERLILLAAATGAVLLLGSLLPELLWAMLAGATALALGSSVD